MNAARPYTVKSAAERLACSEGTVRKMCREGRLPNFRIGIGDKACFRSPASALEEFERCGSSASEADGTPTSESTVSRAERPFVVRPFDPPGLPPRR